MDKKVKILRIINRFNLGGPTFNAAYLTKYLPANYETLLVGGSKYEEEESSEFILENLKSDIFFVEPLNIVDKYSSLI